MVPMLLNDIAPMLLKILTDRQKTFDAWFQTYNFLILQVTSQDFNQKVYFNFNLVNKKEGHILKFLRAKDNFLRPLGALKINTQLFSILLIHFVESQCFFTDFLKMFLVFFGFEFSGLSIKKYTKKNKFKRSVCEK